MTCEHDLAEKETACADGMCPMCLATELAAKNERILALEIAARDFLRAVATRGHLLPSEYIEAHDTLTKLVRGDK